MTTDPDYLMPGDFVWGVATSAHQVEGAVAEDGRLPSIWDTFSHTPGKVAGDGTGDAYRFSTAWPRVRPSGDGPVNAVGLGFYDLLVDALLAAGIGHLEGRHAPGISDISAAVPASYHLLLGHGLAAQAIRAQRPAAQVGLVNLHGACEPASARATDVAAAARLDGHAIRWWLDPIHGRGFPEDMLRVYRMDLPSKAGDDETIAAPLDWLGVNYYTPSVVADDPEGPPPYAREVTAQAGAPRTLLDWEIRADGLEQVLLRLTREYGARRILVTENRPAWADTVALDGRVHDPERLRYLQEHVASCARAIQLGVPLAGYFAWSLLDNLEWADGYRPRFGLVYVDFATQRRVLKDSGAAYADIIRTQHARSSDGPVAYPAS
jgi:beta-glucosidase